MIEFRARQRVRVSGKGSQLRFINSLCDKRLLTARLRVARSRNYK